MFGSMRGVWWWVASNHKRIKVNARISSNLVQDHFWGSMFFFHSWERLCQLQLSVSSVVHLRELTRRLLRFEMNTLLLFRMMSKGKKTQKGLQWRYRNGKGDTLVKVAPHIYTRVIVHPSPGVCRYLCTYDQHTHSTLVAAFSPTGKCLQLL